MKSLWKRTTAKLEASKMASESSWIYTTNETPMSHNSSRILMIITFRHWALFKFSVRFFYSVSMWKKTKHNKQLKLFVNLIYMLAQYLTAVNSFLFLTFKHWDTLFWFAIKLSTKRREKHLKHPEPLMTHKYICTSHTHAQILTRQFKHNDNVRWNFIRYYWC